MKKFTQLVAVCLILFPAIFNEANSKPFTGSSGLEIDYTDTVFFDVLSATYTATYIDLPVKIKTDEQVFALDFEFKFNLQKFTFVNIFNNFGSLQSLGFYNAGDSTLRVTSNSLQVIPNDSVLITVRLALSTSGIMLNSTDMHDIETLLNGTLCAFGVLALPPVGIKELNNVIDFDVYPNPSNGNLNIKLIYGNKDYELELYNHMGELIYQMQLPQNTTGTFVELPQGIASGVYNLVIKSNTIISGKKLIIIRD